MLLPDTGSGETATESVDNTTPRSVSTLTNVTSYETDIRTQTITNTLDTATTATLSVYKGDYIPTRHVNEPDYGWTELGRLEKVFYEKICNATCEQKCGDREPQGDATCYCDWACVHLGDCCIDYEAACLSGPKVTANNYADILRNRTSPSASCYAILEESRVNEIRTVWLLVVASFGISFQADNDSLIIDLCELPQVGNETLATELPVMFRDVIYRNRYCAICNNPGELLNDIITTSEAVHCESATYDESAYWQRYDGDAGDDIDISNCVVMLNLSSFDNQRNGTPRYKCMMDASAVDTCDVHRASPMFDFDYLELTCHTYHVHISGTFIPAFSNPHCAICSGVVDVNCMECDVTIPHDHKPSFCRIINFQDWLKQVTLCAGNSLRDHTTGLCVTPTCPVGHFMLQDKGCTALDVDIRIYFVIASEYRFSRDTYEEVIGDIGIGIVVVDSFNVSSCDTFTVFQKWDEIMPVNSTCCIQETVSRNLSEVVSRVELFDDQVRFRSGITMFVFSQDVSNISSIYVYLFTRFDAT